MTTIDATGTTAVLWAQLGGDPDALDGLELRGAAQVLPSIYDVTGFAAATIAAANLAAAELVAARTSRPAPPVVVDRVAASAAFLSERLLQPRGWELPPLWDPVAGDYRAADRWIRLHTNYAHHLRAVLEVLGVPADRAAVAAAVAELDGAALEAAVVAEGGCAAAMNTAAEWAGNEHGRIATGAPAVAVHGGPSTTMRVLGGLDAGAPPLDGVRVLDLTRVIAGPICTRFLAAQGADVLRLDPPGFEEVGAIVPDATVGKRCASLDLSGAGGRARMAQLVAEADVLVHGYRPGALEGLGLGLDELRAINPALVVASLDAYGWEGPWQGRRGFDSLVQMSCGIAAAGGAAKGTDQPGPLPAQALDHGTGYLLAAGVCRALALGQRDGEAATVRASLVGTANVLVAGPAGDLDRPAPTWPDEVFVDVDTAWGPARRVRCPGTIGGRQASWSRPAGPLGRDEPAFGGASTGP